MINIYALILIFISNLSLYFYTISNSTKLLPAIILTSIFDYALVFAFSRKNKYVKFLQIGFYFLLTLFKISISLYYMHYGDFYIFSRIRQAKHLRGITEFIFVEMSQSIYLFLALIALVIAFLIYKNYGFVKIKGFKNTYKKPALALLAFSFLGLAFSNTFSNLEEVYTSSVKSILTLNSSSKVVAQESYDDLDYILFRNYNHKNKYTGLGKDKNLIIIQVESLQKSFMDREIEDEEITPNLNKLVREKGSIYFSNYFELLGFGNTSDAEYVSLHSMYPNTIDSSYVTYENTKTYGLPLLAKSKGYKTSSLHGYSGEFYNRNFYHKNIGFEKSYFGEYYKQDEKIGMGLSDKSFFNQSLDILKEENKNGPFFSFLITLTSHIPYEMPDEYRIFSKLKPEYENSGVYKYIDSIHYLDKELGNFLDQLDKEGLLDSSIVAIYGDHYAIEINDQKEKKDMSKFLGHEYYYDDMLNIPLVLLVPNLEENIEVKNLGSQVDFYPTIINLLGWNEEVVPMFGIDLLDEKLSKDNVVYPQTHMIKGSYFTEDTIFEKSRVPGSQGGLITRNKKKINLDIENNTSKQGKKLIDYSNYLYDKNLLEEKTNTFKEKN